MQYLSLKIKEIQIQRKNKVLIKFVPAIAVKQIMQENLFRLN